MIPNLGKCCITLSYLCRLNNSNWNVHDWEVIMVKNLIVPIRLPQFPLFIEWTSQTSQARKLYFLGPCSPSILLIVNLMPQKPWYQEVLHRVRAGILAKLESYMWRRTLGTPKLLGLFSSISQTCSKCEELTHFCHACPRQVTSPRCCHFLRAWLGFGHSLSLTAAQCGTPLLGCPYSFHLHYLWVREGCEKYAEPLIFFC